MGKTGQPTRRKVAAKIERKRVKKSEERRAKSKRKWLKIRERNQGEKEAIKVKK